MESPNRDHTVTFIGMTSLYLFHSRAKRSATGQQTLILASTNSNTKEQWLSITIYSWTVTFVYLYIAVFQYDCTIVSPAL